MKKIFYLLCCAATWLCCACSENKVEETPLVGDVAVRIAVPDWAEEAAARSNGGRHYATRAGEGTLYPISVLVVPEGGDNVAKKITIQEGTDFNVSLTDGSYELLAVCGLANDIVPEKLSTTLSVPQGTDFAVGQTHVTVKNGICSPSVVNISAQRQMTWLELQVTGVPDNITKFNVYMQSVYEKFSLHSGWQSSTSWRGRFTQIAMTKSGSAYEGGGIMYPCSDASGVTFAVEATTTNGTTTLLTYTSGKPLAAGTHLTQTLAYSDMVVVEGGINIGGWNNSSDDGSLTTPFGFSIGQQYFSQAATVVNIGSDGKSLNLLAHKPMTATLAEVRTWDFKNIPYALSSEINVQRWAFPTSQISPQNVVNAITEIGWEAFNEQFAANNLTPIDRTATNILAYKDKTTDTFYAYDFSSMTYEPVTDESGSFLIYPLGVISLAQ